MDKPLNETFFANMVEFSRWYSVKMSLLPHPWRGGGLVMYIYMVRDRPLEKSWGRITKKILMQGKINQRSKENANAKSLGSM